MTYLPFFQLLNLYQSQDPPVHLWDQSTFFGATTSSFPKIAWKLDDTAPSTSRSVENGGEGFASKKPVKCEEDVSKSQKITEMGKFS